LDPSIWLRSPLGGTFNGNEEEKVTGPTEVQTNLNTIIRKKDREKVILSKKKVQHSSIQEQSLARRKGLLGVNGEVKKLIGG